ncbi:MAG TPA: hypothetical protein VJB57_13790 [Dehalococcoidia bacterium]|nr:hypothetical protein [Dehalococcoidia bacterium]
MTGPHPMEINCPNCDAPMMLSDAPRHFDFVFPTADPENLAHFQSLTLVEDIEDDLDAAQIALGLWLANWRHLKRQAFDDPEIEIVSQSEMPQLIYSPRGVFIVLDLLRANEELQNVDDRPDLWLVRGEGGITPPR